MGWLAGSLVWTIPAHSPWADAEGSTATTRTTTPRSTDEEDYYNSILRGWRPLIEATHTPPPFSNSASRGGRQLLLLLLVILLLPSSAPRSHKVLTKRASPAPVAWQKGRALALVLMPLPLPLPLPLHSPCVVLAILRMQV